MWERQIRDFGHYLKLERSLSDNSVEGYLSDVGKLRQFAAIRNKELQAADVSPKDLRNFLEYITELGMSAHSQARILSGLKSFYKYLMFEGAIESDPTVLIEGPKLGRKLPDTLSFQEIEDLLEAIDLSSP